MPRVLIEDGPHQGSRDIPRIQGDVLLLSDEKDYRRPTDDPGPTIQRYRRVPSHPDDFVNGYEQRYRWEP